MEGDNPFDDRFNFDEFKYEDSNANVQNDLGMQGYDYGFGYGYADGPMTGLDYNHDFNQDYVEPPTDSWNPVVETTNTDNDAMFTNNVQDSIENDLGQPEEPQNEEQSEEDQEEQQQDETLKKEDPASDEEYIGSAEESDGDEKKEPRAGYRMVRRLVRWNTHVDQLLLLALEYECNRNGIVLPWEAAIRHIQPTSSKESPTQHLTKVRDARAYFGLPIPPELHKSRKTPRAVIQVDEKKRRIYHTLVQGKQIDLSSDPGNEEPNYTVDMEDKSQVRLMRRFNNLPPGVSISDAAAKARAQEQETPVKESTKKSTKKVIVKTEKVDDAASEDGEEAEHKPPRKSRATPASLKKKPAAVSDDEEEEAEYKPPRKARTTPASSKKKKKTAAAPEDEEEEAESKPPSKTRPTPASLKKSAAATKSKAKETPKKPTPAKPKASSTKPKGVTKNKKPTASASSKKVGLILKKSSSVLDEESAEESDDDEETLAMATPSKKASTAEGKSRGAGEPGQMQSLPYTYPGGNHAFYGAPHFNQNFMGARGAGGPAHFGYPYNVPANCMGTDMQQLPSQNTSFSSASTAPMTHNGYGSYGNYGGYGNYGQMPSVSNNMMPGMSFGFGAMTDPFSNNATMPRGMNSENVNLDDATMLEYTASGDQQFNTYPDQFATDEKPFVQE